MTTPEQQARVQAYEKLAQNRCQGAAIQGCATEPEQEIANLIAERDVLKAELERVKAERDDWGKRWHQERRKVAELRYPGMTGVVKPQSKELAAIKGAGEPVAWVGAWLTLPVEGKAKYGINQLQGVDLMPGTRLYTRPCVPLTDDQITAFCNQHAKYQEEGYELSGWYDFARAIEAHIKGAKGC